MVGVRVGSALVLVEHDWQVVINVFPDQSYVEAKPSYDPESEARAVALGHENVWEMTVAHEIAHHYVSTILWHKYSPTLWHAAQKREDDSLDWFKDWREEEQFVFALTAWAIKGQDSEKLQELSGTYQFLLSGSSLDDVAEEFKTLLRLAMKRT